MRDRLIELISQVQYMGGLEGQLADHLLANGVIVPPCKVGDKVYYHKAELNETCPTKVIEIHNNYYTPSMPLWITIEYESKLVGRQVEKMASEVFVMLCKPTAEEAEKALKERSENGYKGLE